MKIVGLDIETTGLEPQKGHRIIEFCASIYDAQTTSQIKHLKTFTQRINPLREIDRESQNVHGISLFDLKGCPEWPAVAPAVKKILDLADLIVVHNAEFDIKFIYWELERIGIETLDGKYYCTMAESRNTTPFGKLPNLAEFCFAYNVQYEPEKAHAAEYDVQVMMQAFFNGLRTGHIKIDGLEA